jgi:predicted tellurium resistance membrane protein TerC
MFSWITDPQAWIALGTLTALEIVLGIDNIIFVFSPDSATNAIGMAEHLPVMVAAVVIAVPVRLRSRIAPHRPSPLPAELRMIDAD